MDGILLPVSTPEQSGLRPDALARLVARIDEHVASGRYLGAQVAIARHGNLAFWHSFGEADPGHATTDGTPFLLYSNTKVITAAALWVLAEHGALRFTDRVSDHLPEFARHGKQDVTLLHLLTHQGGFPDAVAPAGVYTDHALLRRAVCDFTLQWAPGSRVFYHPSSAHWTAAAVIEAITGQDYRDVIRELVIVPLGLDGELFVGVPDGALPRCAGMFEPGEGGLTRHADDTEARKRAGVPGGGGYGSARAMAAFYQYLLGGGGLHGRRLVGPRTLAYALRDITGERVAEQCGYPMHFALGPYTRGNTIPASDLGIAAGPRTFGHGGAGSSLCWGDPDTGVSFAYVSNARHNDPWHSLRMDTLSHLVQGAIL